MKMRIEVDGFEQERAQWKDKQVLYLYHLKRFNLIDIKHLLRAGDDHGWEYLD